MTQIRPGGGGNSPDLSDGLKPMGRKNVVSPAWKKYRQTAKLPEQKSESFSFSALNFSFSMPRFQRISYSLYSMFLNVIRSILTCDKVCIMIFNMYFCDEDGVG